MKERNRTISRILLIVSAGILLLQTLLMALLLKESVTMRIAMPLLFLVGEIIAGGVLCFATLNPDKFNRNYTLKKREGGLRFERITYGPDPEGLRYISAGINSLPYRPGHAHLSFQILQLSFRVPIFSSYLFSLSV